MKIGLTLNFLKNLLNFWKNISYILIILLLTPIVMLILSSFQNNIDTWLHLFDTKLSIYFYNTLSLILGVGILSITIGVSCAWILAKYKFFLSNILEWALLLPAAIPAYIVAYCYTDFLEYGGIIQTALREIFNWQSAKEYFFPEIRSMTGAILILSFALYPYIYFITKVAFTSTPKNLFNVAKIHGKSEFLYVALPMARPAIIAGLSLVLMETISDFGTVEFLAVETVTLGIFNLWLGMNNLSAASQLSFLAFTFIVVLLGVELSARKNQKFNNPQASSFEKKIEEISYTKSLLLFFICLLPILFGFIIPVLILINLSMQSFDQSNFYYFIDISLNSISISLFGAFLTILFSFIVVVAVKYHGGKKFSFFATIAGSGYAFPGVILALGTTFFLSFIQNNINELFLNFNLNWNLTLIGTFTALLYTYICRFNAIGIGYINSGIQRVSPNLLEAGMLQGVSFNKSLFKIIFPLIRPSILTGFLIVFVDIFKELPVTLLLRPFNFETLATYVYQYAKEEMLEQCALAALLIILIGTIPVFILNKTINLSYKKH
jgi:iron(III) transport system permease protein